MVQLISEGVYWHEGKLWQEGEAAARGWKPQAAEGRKKTLAYQVLTQHSDGQDGGLHIHFDSLTSPDIGYMGIVQTAVASGLDHFPLPYVMTNCHNTLAAVGGTVNEDDHVFGLSAAKKFGGIYVPPHMAVIHQYMRERMTGGGRMILGSDSHTRYGAFGTMGVGEGGPELVKQLLGHTYDIPLPQVVAVYLKGAPRHGIGPQDVALAIEKAVYKKGFVKNKVLEFVGPGITGLSMDFRNGIDVMTTETTCLSTIWCTDGVVRQYLTEHQRPEAYKEMNPGDMAYYDGAVVVDLGQVESMIAMPFHPSHVYTLKELNAGGRELLQEIEQEALKSLERKDLSLHLADQYYDGKMHCDTGVIAGCSGGLYENIMAAARILKGKNIGPERFTFSVYPSSQPIYVDLMRKGALLDLMDAGTIVRSAFCGPCFGACDTPNNHGFSIRHTTRNFPTREGSKPGSGQLASVALMDARSIAATAAQGGALTPATEVEYDDQVPAYHFDSLPYDHKVVDCYQKGQPEVSLVYGPAIKPWPSIQPLNQNLLVQVAAYLDDPVTSTDDLIPSGGETSSHRSDPYALAEFALSQKAPEYVGRAKAVQALEKARQAGQLTPELTAVYAALKETLKLTESVEALAKDTSLGSVIYANKPGDGSAREQAASCQRVLGGAANLALEYATKRYRSTVMNWGMLPFLMDPEEKTKLALGAWIYLPKVRETLLGDTDAYTAYVFQDGKAVPLSLHLGDVEPAQKQILAAGCLINYYAQQRK